MEMHDKRKTLDEMMKAADERLMKFGVQDGVNMFLATQEAKDAVETVYTNWLKGLQVYVDKMPDVACEAVGKFMEELKREKPDFVEITFLQFKRTLAGTAAKMSGYMNAEDVKLRLSFTASNKQLWLGTITKQARDLVEVINMKSKVDIAVVAFTTFKTDEHVKALIDLLKEEPNCAELMLMVEAKLSIRAMRSVIMAQLGNMSGMPGCS